MAVCPKCGKEFVPKKFYHGGTPRMQTYCGKACSSSLNIRIAKARSLSPESRQKGAAKRRGRGNVAPYVKRGGIHEHRFVMEAMIGRRLRADELVHHIDGNKRNNAPSNLELTTRAEHARLHGLERGGLNPKKTS